MIYQAFKKIYRYLGCLALFIVLLFNSGISYASVINCNVDFNEPMIPGAAALPNALLVQVGPEQILCFALRGINFMLFSVGVVLVLVILYGALKLALSLGDPQGFDSAKQTWTYAVIGFLIVVGFYAIFNIAFGALGSGLVGGPSEIFERLYCKIANQFGMFIYMGGTGPAGCPGPIP